MHVSVLESAEGNFTVLRGRSGVETASQRLISHCVCSTVGDVGKDISDIQWFGQSLCCMVAGHVLVSLLSTEQRCRSKTRRPASKLCELRGSDVQHTK